MSTVPETDADPDPRHEAWWPRSESPDVNHRQVVALLGAILDALYDIGDQLADLSEVAESVRESTLDS